MIPWEGIISNHVAGAIIGAARVGNSRSRVGPEEDKRSPEEVCMEPPCPPPLRHSTISHKTFCHIANKVTFRHKTYCYLHQITIY